LFPQIVFTLSLLHLLAHPDIYALFKLEDLCLLTYNLTQELQPLYNSHGLEYSLLIFNLESHMGSNSVSQLTRFVDVANCQQCLRRYLLAYFRVVLKLLNQGAHKGLDLGNV